MKDQKVWFITGISKGFGFEIAKEALRSGDKVVGTVRSRPDQIAISLDSPAELLVVQADVTKEEEVRKAIEQAVLYFGGIDVLVNNAGFGMITAIEEASDEEARKLYDTNVFGVLNVIRAALPTMRRQRSGHIINFSSLLGYDALAGWSLYGSTKFALEGLSKGLARELAPFDIHVTAVAPGLFSTDFLSTNSYAVPTNIITDYDENAIGQMRRTIGRLHGNQPGDPKKLAEVIVALTDVENPPLHLPLGKDSISMYRNNIDKTSKEIDQWEDISFSTDHDKS